MMRRLLAMTLALFLAVPPAALAQTSIPANRVDFADGEDLQQKLDEGDLSGGGGAAPNLGATADADSVTITNDTAGTDATIAEATRTIAGVLAAIDKHQLERFYLARDVGGVPGVLDETDIEAAIAAHCDAPTAQIQATCNILVDGTVTQSGTVHVTGDGQAPVDGVTSEATFNIRLIGTGPAHLQLPSPPASPTDRCSTTFQWEGPAGDTMIQVHAGRRVELVDFCVNGAGPSGVAGYGVAITASDDAGEVSKEVRIRGLNIYGFEDTWAGVLSQEQMIGIALLPADSLGTDPPYAEDAQIDNLVIRDTVINTPRGFLCANGPSNGVRLENVHRRYTDYGVWVEDCDTTIVGGFSNNLASAGSSGDEAAVCDAARASVLIGSTSADQPSTVQWRDPNPEIDCGLAFDTIAATNPADTRNSSFSLVGGRFGVGGNGQTIAGRYNHWGSFSVLGTQLGIRNGELFEDGYLSLLPPDGGTLQTFIDSGTIGVDWDSGLFQVRRNANVVSVIGADQISGDDVEILNRLIDRDGDGLSDYVYISGDFNGDASVTNMDWQDAITSLLDTDSPRTVKIGSGVYDGSGVSDSTLALVSLPANTSLLCDAGATLVGPDDTQIATMNSTRLITNSAVVDPNNLEALGDNLDDPGLVIDGCTVRYAFGASYNSDSWVNPDQYGVYLERAPRAVVRRNTMTLTNHSCGYFRSLSDAIITENYFGEGCGAANNTGSASQQGLYIYAAEGVDSERIIVSNNTCVEAGTDCFHTRAQFTCVGTADDGPVDGRGDEDGNLCRLDNSTTGGATDCTATGGTCAEARIRDVTFVGNSASGAGNACYRLGSAENSTISGNIASDCTYGIELAGISDGFDLCDGATPSDDANCHNSVIGNTIGRTTNNAIIAQGGNQDTTIRGNSLSSIQATCARIFPPFDRIDFSSNSIQECNVDGGNSQNFSVFEVSGALANAGSSTATELTLSNNVASRIGIDSAGRVRGALMRLSYAVDGLNVFGNSIAQGSQDDFAFEAVRIDANDEPSNFYARDNFTGKNTEFATISDALGDAISKGSRIEHLGDPRTIFTGGTCGCVDDFDTDTNADQIQDAGSPDGYCDADTAEVISDGAEWVDLSPSTGGEYVCRRGEWSKGVTATSGATCLILRDSDDGGDSACSVLDGTFSCEPDTNGICGDAT